jgi:hypothetical protein
VPTNEPTGSDGNLGEEQLREIVSRLEEVRRRCDAETGVGDRRGRAEQSLDAVLSDLNACLVPGAEAMETEDLDLRLAATEELFEAVGSPGFARVIASVRGSVSPKTEEPEVDEEPPPPVRFEPPPKAIKRPEPRKTDKKVRSPAEKPRRKSLRWLVLTILIGGALGAAALIYLEQSRADLDARNSSGRSASEVSSSSSVTPPQAPPPIRAPSGREQDDGIDLHEEEMAAFTLEIRLSETALNDGDLDGSLRHFAAAAAIDRHHPRVVGMGKALIAAMLREADLAADRGDRNRVGKQIRSARNLARGLGLDDSTGPNDSGSESTPVGFQDTTPSDREALQKAIGHPVRLFLKTRDVIYGRLTGIEDDLLLVDAYSGVNGGRAGATTILSSTIGELRIYD